MSFLYILFLIVQFVTALYILTPFFSLFMYGCIQLFRIKRPFDRRSYQTNKDYEIGIVITAHQEVDFITPLVDSILKQTYGNFHVYVVADDCNIEFLHFEDSRIHVLQPFPALHSKVKSLSFALNNFITSHDVMIIFDSDNLIHPRFLEVINNHFKKGYRVVQADFKPKNTDSLYARMDAVGDMFNFFVDREVRMRLGISSAIWGSGIAFEPHLFKSIDFTKVVGGFDKKLQATLLLNTDIIAFAPDAVLFDEKVSSGKSLENQRARWIHSYFNYFKDSFSIFSKGIKSFNFNLIYFGFVLLRPPLFMVIFAGLCITIVNYFISQILYFIWIGILASFIISFGIIVLIKAKDIRFLKTFFAIPLFAIRQILSILKLRKASRSFLKTQHSKLLYIDDLVSSKYFPK